MQRQHIVRSRLLFDADPGAVAASHADALQNLAASVLDAQALLSRVQWQDDALAHAGALALAAGVDGVRADLVMLRAARASAALDGRDAVTVADVDAVAELALHHRRQAGSAATRRHKLLKNPNPPPRVKTPAPRSRSRPELAAVLMAIGVPCPPCLWAPCGLRLQECSRQKKPEPPRPRAPEVRLAAGGGAQQLYQPVPMHLRWRCARHPARQHSAAPSPGCPPCKPKAAMPWPRSTCAGTSPKPSRLPLHLLLLDTSGSMRQGGRLARAKGYAAQVLEQAARASDHVALLCFGGQGVEVLVPPSPARRAAAVRVQQRGGGGGTPMAQAMAAADNLMAQHRRVRGTGASAAPTVLWLLTDGRTLEQPRAPEGADQLVVVDFEDAKVRVGRCADWAARWGTEYRRGD